MLSTSSQFSRPRIAAISAFITVLFGVNHTLASPPSDDHIAHQIAASEKARLLSYSPKENSLEVRLMLRGGRIKTLHWNRSTQQVEANSSDQESRSGR